MAREKDNKKEIVPRANKSLKTMERKARKVIQSCGIPYFEQWAEKSFTGGSRRKGSRASMKGTMLELYKRLIRNYEDLNRKMDQPPEEETK